MLIWIMLTFFFTVYMKKWVFLHKFISSLKLLNKYFGWKFKYTDDIHSYNAAGNPDSLQLKF